MAALSGTEGSVSGLRNIISNWSLRRRRGANDTTGFTEAADATHGWATNIPGLMGGTIACSGYVDDEEDEAGLMDLDDFEADGITGMVEVTMLYKSGHGYTGTVTLTDYDEGTGVDGNGAFSLEGTLSGAIVKVGA
jgi:hypothetical protein